MPMTRQERVALHTNQKRMQLSSNMPNEKSLVEGKPEYRETFKGLYQYVKYNNEVYSQLLTKDTRTLQEEINDTVNNITITNLTVTDPIDVEDGGTGHTTLNDGYVLLGNGTSSLNQLDVTTSGSIVIGDGTTAPTTYDAFSSSTGTLKVSAGGTGTNSLTDHGVLVGSGASGVTPLTAGTNGQILVGSTGSDPVFVDLTCDDGLSATTGTGTLEIDLDLKSAGGLAIESNELALSLGDASITGTLGVGDGGTGITTVATSNMLTGNGSGALSAESNLTFDGSVLAITGSLTTTTTAAVGTDLTVTGGDVILGAVATNGTMTVVDSAASTAGNTLIIGGSDVTAGGGGTANVQGGAVTIKAGTSTGTAVSGSILFQTAPAGSASGTAASDESLATVLTIAGDASSTFTGDVNVGDDLSLTSDLAVFNMGDGNDFTITHDGTTGASLAGTPVSIYSTGNLILDASLDVILDTGASGDNILFKNNGALRCNWGMGTSPSLTVTGAFTIDGSAAMELDAVGVFTVSHNGTDQIVGDTSAHLYLNAYNTTKHANDYGINNQGSLYMFTTGNADFIQNYSFLSYYHVPDNSGADLYEAYPS
jgi:hypothetical protein